MADELTDSELRRQLQAFGEKKLGPITATTRPIYVKKLNHYRAAENKANKTSRKASPGRKLLGFSSDESEDEGTRGRRKSAAPTRARGRGAARRQVSSSSQPSLARPSLRSRRSMVSDEDDTINVSTASAAVQASMHSAFSSPSNASMYDDPDGFDSSDTDMEQSASANSSYNYPELVTRSINTSPGLDSSSFLDRTSSQSPASGSTESNKTDSKTRRDIKPASNHVYLQGPTPRNYARRSNTGRTRTLNTLPSSQQNNVNHDQANHKTVTHNNLVQRRVGSGSFLSDDDLKKEGFKTEEDPESYRYTQYISVVLVIVAGVFFAVLGFMYLFMEASPSSAPSKDNWLICGKDKSSGCYQKDQVVKARDMVIILYDELTTRAGNYECGFESERNMSKQAALEFFAAKYGPHFSPDITANQQTKGYSFGILLDLISYNTHWTIKMYDSHGVETGNPISMAFLDTTDADLGLLCRLARAFYKVTYGVFFIVIFVFSVLMVLWFLRYRWKKREMETRQVYELVEKIIDILKRNYDQSQANTDIKPFVAIPHVRDMLISPRERRSLLPLWEKAVKFLSANESRIRVETQTIHGEDFQVWRWLQATPNGSKVWQGQAFDTDVQNCPRYSLTQCLKIRNMFDPDIECDDNWHVRIQDAILEKCGSNHQILHVAVDKTSREGCVYVKCTSSESAGRAYKALHGWWFDGNLVTVKYLRLERYHERFPDAAQVTSTLTPSNNQRLSLSQPYHRSIIEVS